MSSDQIYNASDSMEPNREEGPHRPCSVYGRDKKRAEEAMLACLHDAVALRLTWMYDYPSSERPGGCGLLGSLLEAGREKRILKLPVHDYRGITYVWDIIRNMEAAMRLYDRIVDRDLLVRRVSVAAAHVEEESGIREQETFEQLDLFTDYEAMEKQREQERQDQEREKRMQKAMLDIKKKFGKNAILKGMNLEEGATTMERNKQIGGHKA